MNQKDQIKKIEDIISCYIPDFKFENFNKTKEEMQKMTWKEKTKHLDDLKIIENCLNMINLNRKLGLI